ncbi:hypothetical protein [Enterobacter kobei]|uniref:hypothetical protein n=1 Tax=Enterobacter kobei TaxID=208224 RepID=UPI000682C614|nr:hypothetical protein [Enterobacter kobei]
MSLQESNIEKKVNNGYAWGLLLFSASSVFASALYVFWYFMSITAEQVAIALVAYTVIGLVLATKDRRELLTSGYENPPSRSWVLLMVPVYFLLRPYPLVGKRSYSIVMCLAVFILPVALGLRMAKYEDLDATACKAVTRILKEQAHSERECRGIIDREKISSGFYTARAVLDSGAKIDVSIEEQEDNNIYVKIKSFKD